MTTDPAFAADLDATIDAVGPRLRSARKHRGVTLSDLSDATGISVSTLSRLESGQRKPTLELLLLLARAHQLPLDELVAAPSTGDPRVHPRPIVRHGVTILPLTRRPGGIQSFKHIYPPNTPGGERTQRTHEGYEWMYVLNGTMKLLLGDREIDLRAGEVAEFDTHVPHWFGNASDRPAEIISLFGPQGERVHVRTGSTTE